MVSNSRSAESESGPYGVGPWIVAALCFLSCFTGVLLPGCSRFQHTKQKKYHTLSPDEGKEANQAKALNKLALEAMQAGEWEKADELLSDALAIDVNYGPAHNNLGQIYLRRHQLYLAAWEFEFAANLMPERLQPHFNLGLVYETAGQYDEAREHYQAAFDMAPSDTNAVANLARICVKMDDDPVYIAQLLRQVVLGDPRGTWVRWAKDLLATRYRLVTPANEEPDASANSSNDSTSTEAWASPIEFPEAAEQIPSGLPVPEVVSPPSETRKDLNLPPFSIEPQPSLLEAQPMDVGRMPVGLPTVPQNFSVPYPVQHASAVSKSP